MRLGRKKKKKKKKIEKVKVFNTKKTTCISS